MCVHVYLHMQWNIKSANKKNELLPFAIGMDLKDTMLSEIGQIKTNTE